MPKKMSWQLRQKREKRNPLFVISQGAGSYHETMRELGRLEKYNSLTPAAEKRLIALAKEWEKVKERTEDKAFQVEANEVMAQISRLLRKVEK